MKKKSYLIQSRKKNNSELKQIVWFCVNHIQNCETWTAETWNIKINGEWQRIVNVMTTLLNRHLVSADAIAFAIESSNQQRTMFHISEKNWFIFAKVDLFFLFKKKWRIFFILTKSDKTQNRDLNEQQTLVGQMFIDIFGCAR